MEYFLSLSLNRFNISGPVHVNAGLSFSLPAEVALEEFRPGKGELLDTNEREVIYEIVSQRSDLGRNDGESEKEGSGSMGR